MEKLQYPLDNQDYRARVDFTAVHERGIPITAQALGLVKEGYLSTNASTQEVVNETLDTKARKDSIAAASGNDKSVTRIQKPVQTPVAKITLYLPQSITFSDAAEYTNVDLGIVGGAVATGIRNQASGLELAKDLLKSSLPSIASIKEAVTSGLQTEAAQVAALRLTRFSDGIQGAVETETGITLNPNRRATFKGIGLRRFNYTFSLVPTSRKEAAEINRIVQVFREEMYPETASDIDISRGLSAGLRFPSKFNIRMYYQKTDGGYTEIGKILPCFLERVGVTLNPNGMAWHDDGNPQETQISLSFLEERALNKADIVSEYSRNQSRRRTSAGAG